MNTADISTGVVAVQTIGDTILTTIQAADPGVALPAASAELILDLVAKLAATALTAWSAASGTPITAASVLALLPNQTALTAPDA